MWDIVWVSPQGHRSVSVSRHFLLQVLQWQIYLSVSLFYKESPPKSTRCHQTMPTQHGISPCPTVWVGFTNRLSVPFNRHFNETTFAVSSLCKSCKNQTPSSEVVLLVLDMTWTCRVKKAVLRVTKSMAVLIPIHGLSVLTDVYGCFNPSRKSIWLSLTIAW